MVEKTEFDDKLKNLNKKINSNIEKHVETEKKLTDLTKEVEQIPRKGYDFLLGRKHFLQVMMIILVFGSILSSLILDRNKKVTSWISTGISSAKIKPFNTNLEPTMS